MNICVISPSYPTPKTIVYVFVDQLCKAFADKGVNVSIIAPQSLTRSWIHHEPLVPKKIKLKTPKGNEINLYRPIYISCGNGKFQKYTNYFFNKAVKKHFCKLKQKPDVIYGHFWSSIYSAYPIAKKYNIPLFGASGEECVNDYDFYSIDEKIELSSYLSGIINVSTKNQTECLDLKLVSKDKTIVIPNAVNLSIFHHRDKEVLRKKLGLKKDDYVVSFVGQFINRKGTLRLCEALKKIDDGKVKAIFIGAGIEEPEYDGIIFKGRVSHDEIPDLLYASDVFALPTENEGCSNAVIEAMACHLPIISTDAPFNYDILNSDNSIMVNCHDIDAIADALQSLKDDKQKRESMSKAARETALNLSIEKRAEKILNFINSKINKNG